MSSPIPVAYVFHGPDEPGLREGLAEFCARVTGPDPGLAALNTTRLDGASIAAGDIQMAAAALPFLAEARLVLVENLTDSAGGRTVVEALPDLIAGLPGWARVVFVETGAGDSGQDSDAARRRKSARRAALKKLIALVEHDPRGRIVEFAAPQDMRRWLAQRAARHQARIESGAAQALAERIGEDFTLADTELAKLAAYAAARPISAGDVEKLTPFTPEASIFRMVDALGERNGPEALRLLRQLLDAGDEPLRVFGMIVRQYRLLILMREHLDGGGTPGGAAAALEVQDFVARKLASQARRYSLEQLERIYRYLLETDLAMKGGLAERDAPGRAVDRLNPTYALEELVVRLGARS